MNRKSLFIRTLGAAATLAAVTLCSLNARAEIVFGNLGATGTVALSDTTTDFGPSAALTLALAQGFTTGTSNLTVQSITLGLFGATSPNTVSRTVALYSSDENNPFQLLFTSSAVNVGEQGKYTFNFTNAVLSPNTNYWIVPQQGSSWYLSGNSNPPAGLNNSGYAYLGTRQQLKSNPGVWETTTLPYSVSVETVPKPSSLVMAGLGIGGVAMFQWTRRRR